jgi:nucleoid-associated protein YgaU
MSGKHREARRPILPRVVLGGGYILGSAVAVSTALAPPASAEPDWDAIAACESGGNWAINTGNGFHGGLQFTLQTWHGYGGAGMPENASREQQITVARKVLAGQGIGAWPVCGKRGGSATTVKAPRHAAPSVPAIPLAASAPPRHAAPEIPASATDYSVTDGDTLASIADAAHTSGGWQALYDANRDSVADPNLIAVGQHLRLRPATTGGAVAPAAVSIEEPATVGPMLSDTGDVLADNGVTARPGMVRAS